jgi:hypothetical protein
VLVRPRTLLVARDDVDSLDFHFGKKQELVAAGLKVKSNVKTTLEPRPYFECPVTPQTDTLRLLLFDGQERPVATGLLPLLARLAQAKYGPESSGLTEPMVQT